MKKRSDKHYKINIINEMYPSCNSSMSFYQAPDEGHISLSSRNQAYSRCPQVREGVLERNGQE